MDFFTIELDINDRRRYFLELKEPESLSTERPRSFVVDVPPATGCPLLSMAADGSFKSFVEGQPDLKVSQCTFTTHQENNRIMIVAKVASLKPVPPTAPTPAAAATSIEDLEGFTTFEPPKQKKKEVISELPAITTELQPLNPWLGLRFNVGTFGASLSLINIKQLSDSLFENNILRLIIRLELDDKTYQNEILFYLSHPSQFLGMAIDFGSESSQMAIRRNAQKAPFHVEHPENENLFQNIYSYHRYKGWVSNDSSINYYQKEEGTLFYKSIFLLRQQLSGNYDNLDELPFIQEVEKNLLMLVSDNDITTLAGATYHQLPNLKILHQHDTLLNALSFEVEKNGYPLPLKLKELKDKVYNTILEIMIVSFLKKEMTRYSNAKRIIRFMLLVPNNYDVVDIHKVQTQLQWIFESLANSDEYRDWLLGWEIMTISESDASFLGFLETFPEKVTSDKDFIIIDSGKGTTDFSIIRTGRENIYNVTPIYRNGFTGAGNMVTYALFETLLHYLRAHGDQDGSDLNYINHKILDTLADSKELELRNKFYEELERLKYNFKDQSYKDAVSRNWQNAKNGDITLANIAAKNQEANLGLGTLTRLLEDISISGDPYGYVQDVCTFIADGVVRHLRSIKENKKDMTIAGVVLTGRAFKFGMLAEMVSRRLQQELGVSTDKIQLLKGNALKDICIKGVFNTAILLNAEITGMPIQLLYDEAQPVVDSSRERGAGNWKNLLNKILGDMNTSGNVQVKTIDEDLKYAELPRSRFLIGSKAYYVGSDELMRDSGKGHHTISIDFTHSGFMLRRMRDGKVDLVERLAEVRESSDLALVIPSVFPNYINRQYLESLEKNISPEEADTQVKGGLRDDLLF